jgi:hypothetical protein
MSALTKDDFAVMLSNGKKLSPTTIKNRVFYIWKLYRDIGDDATDLSFLGNYAKVMKYVRESEKTDVQKTRLFHILSMLETPAGKIVSVATKKRFRTAANKLRDAARVEAMDNTMTDKDKENYISLQQANLRLEAGIIDLFNKYEMPRSRKISDEDFNKWNIEHDRKNIKTFARELQKHVLLGVYTWQPALRSDWGTLEITSASVNRLATDKNWLQVLRGGRVRIIMNVYKNAKSMGNQIIEVESLKLKQFIKYWINLIGRITGTSPQFLFWYELTANKPAKFNSSRDNLTKAISRASDQILGTHLSVNSFRHMWEMDLQSTDDYKRATMAEKAELHRKLLHGTMMGQQYNFQRRDAMS